MNLTDTERDRLLNGYPQTGETERDRLARVAGEIVTARLRHLESRIRAEIHHALDNGHRLDDGCQGVGPGERIPAVRISHIEGALEAPHEPPQQEWPLRFYDRPGPITRRTDMSTLPWEGLIADKQGNVLAGFHRDGTFHQWVSTAEIVRHCGNALLEHQGDRVTNSGSIPHPLQHGAGGIVMTSRPGAKSYAFWSSITNSAPQPPGMLPGDKWQKHDGTVWTMQEDGSLTRD